MLINERCLEYRHGDGGGGVGDGGGGVDRRCGDLGGGDGLGSGRSRDGGGRRGGGGRGRCGRMVADPAAPGPHREARALHVGIGYNVGTGC